MAHRFLPGNAEAYREGECERVFLSDGAQLAAVGDVIVYSRLQIDACLGCEVILYAYTCVDRPLPGSTYRMTAELVWNTVRDMEALECPFYGDIHLHACRGITGETFVMPETVGKPERDADIMQLLVVLNAECFAGSELRPEKRILQSGFQTPTLIQFLAERESHDDGGMMLLVLNNPAAVILGNLHESDGIFSQSTLLIAGVQIRIILFPRTDLLREVT